ncbi:hypothetical protein KSP39_PZI008085 [Platanthera zijinensis]|uniref:Tf2-1-like SH3-like domain-containing protein n=1 Tax=Platanthera zijinensis TaxID=2320716 RepID=A0AAP0BMF5_9ASPA
MDFVHGFPRLQCGNDSIWVIVDRLTTVAHFLPNKRDDSVEMLAKLYVEQIVRLHGSPRSILGQKLASPNCWEKKVEDATSTICSIRERILIAQDQQAKYYNAKHRNVEFAVGDWVYLKIKPFKGVSRIRRLKKLSPRYLGPLEVVERVGEAAYRLALSSELGGLHDVFHISVLRKAVKDPAQVIENDQVPVEYGLTTKVRPIQIEDLAEKQLRNKMIGIVKVRWDNCGREELTWEREQTMRAELPELFS